MLRVCPLGINITVSSRFLGIAEISRLSKVSKVPLPPPSRKPEKCHLHWTSFKILNRIGHVKNQSEFFSFTDVLQLPIAYPHFFDFSICDWICKAKVICESVDATVGSKIYCLDYWSTTTRESIVSCLLFIKSSHKRL